MKTEVELIAWMIEFYRDCEKLLSDLSARKHENVSSIRVRYKDLKTRIKSKAIEVNKVKHGYRPHDLGLFNRCVSNIAESAAYGFGAPTNTTKINDIYISVEEGAYKITRFIEEKFRTVD